MADITDVIEFYRNLLIIQYSNKTKARETIRILARTILASGIAFDVRDGYNLETAVGVQLDVIGKYVGVDRFFTVNDPRDYFAFTDYIENDPDSQDKFGLTDYASFDDFQYNGTMNYNSVISVENRLSDDDFRVVIKLKILQNNINHSHRSIDEGIFEFFGLSVRPDSIGNMEMYYFINESATAIVRAALTKNILPRPMGVGLTLIENVSGEFYGFATYSNLNPSNTAGFQRYSGYGTKDGKILTYNQMTVV